MFRDRNFCCLCQKRSAGVFGFVFECLIAKVFLVSVVSCCVCLCIEMQSFEAEHAATFLGHSSDAIANLFLATLAIVAIVVQIEAIANLLAVTCI